MRMLAQQFQSTISRKIFAVLSVVLLIVVASAVATEIGPTRLVSAAGQAQLSGGGNSSMPIFSGNGRFLAFLSEANNLVTNDDHRPFLDLFVRDLFSGTTTLVSVDRSGLGGGDGSCTDVSISSNGLVLAFASRAANLVLHSPTNVPEVYVRNLATGTTILARTNEATGTSAGPRGSGFPLLSADGRHVAFVTAASGSLTPDVFIRDIEAGTITLVSASSNGLVSGSTYSEPTSISADGNKVAFLSYSTVIAPGAGSPNQEVFVRDVSQQKTVWASSTVSNFFPGLNYFCDQVVLTDTGSHVIFVAKTGSTGFLFRVDLQSGELVQITDLAAWPSVSSDGRYVAFYDTTNVFVWDGNTDSTTLVNVNSSGTASTNGHSYSSVLSADGSKVVFLSDSTDLTAEETHGQVQVFIHDLLARTTQLVSRGLDGSGLASADLAGILPAISPDGTLIAFDTADASVVADDSNQASDVFVHSLISATTELVSRRAPSLPCLTGVGASTVARNCLSADGRFLLFKSSAADLLNGDTNGTPDLFLRDLKTGSNALVSAQTDDLSGTNIATTGSELSGDGRYAVFSQRYWPSGAAAPQEEVFRRDLLSGSLALVSATTNGARSGGATSASMTADGRWVVFQSAVSGLVTNAYGVGTNIFMRDSAAERTILISSTPSGSPANGDSWAPRITPDGRWVVFLSRNSSLLSPGFSSLFTQVLARDMVSNRTYLVSLDPRTGTASFGSVSRFALSAVGRYVAFGVGALNGSLPQSYVYDLLAHSNLLVCVDCGSPSIARDGRWMVFQQPFSGTATRQVVWKDIVTGVTNIASVNNAFEPGSATSSAPVVTPDGRYVIFLSSASNLGSGGGLPGLFVRDVLQRKTLLLSLNVNGTAPAVGNTGPPILSGDGQTVLFHSFAGDLVEQDFNYNRDIFLLRVSRGDSDGDGMDDDWEIAYFGDLSRDGQGDFDQDGQTDLAEFLAGTDPTNGASILQVLTIDTPGSSETKVLWSAIPGKTYQVQYKTNLNDSGWANLSGPLTTASSTGVATDNQTSTIAGRYYRVLLVE